MNTSNTRNHCCQSERLSICRFLSSTYDVCMCKKERDGKERASDYFYYGSVRGPVIRCNGQFVCWQPLLTLVARHIFVLSLSTCT